MVQKNHTELWVWVSHPEFMRPWLESLSFTNKNQINQTDKKLKKKNMLSNLPC